MLHLKCELKLVRHILIKINVKYMIEAKFSKKQAN
jgi:hypothetical protein